MRLTDIKFTKSYEEKGKGKIVLVGMATDGPVRKPFTFRESSNPTEILGSNQLSNAFNTLEETGIDRSNIIIYRLNGNHGSTIFKGIDDTDELEFLSTGTSNNIRETHISLSHGVLSVLMYETVIEQVGEDVVRRLKLLLTTQYRLSNYSNWDSLIDDINNDADLGIIECVVRHIGNNKKVELKEDLSVHYLEGLDEEEYLCLTENTKMDTHKLEYWKKVFIGIIGSTESPYETPLSGINSEMLLVTDIYFDDLPELGSVIGQMAINISEDNDVPCMVLMNTSPIPSKKEIPEWYYDLGNGKWGDGEQELIIDEFEDINRYIFNLDTMAEKIDTTAPQLEHLQVIIGEDGIGPIAPYYASTYLQTPLHLPVSNKELKNTGFGEELSKTTIANLQSTGYICIVPSIRKNYVPYYAQTFHRKGRGAIDSINIKRVLSRIIYDLKTTLDEYIGKPQSTLTKTVIESIVGTYLEPFKDNNILKGYTLELGDYSHLSYSGRLDIHLDLDFFTEINSVKAGFSIETKDGDN